MSAAVDADLHIQAHARSWVCHCGRSVASAGHGPIVDPVAEDLNAIYTTSKLIRVVHKATSVCNKLDVLPTMLYQSTYIVELHADKIKQQLQAS